MPRRFVTLMMFMVLGVWSLAAFPGASAAAEEQKAGAAEAGPKGPAGAAQAGEAARDAAFDAKVPATWKLSARLAKGSAERQALVADLTSAKVGAGEQALTAEEAEALLDDPRAELIYGEKTVAIVAPSMVKRHRQEHVDLLKIFLKPERLEAGARFYREKQAVLEAAQKRHGVDPAVIVSILMWESRLGTITGDWFAFNSFTSQAFFADAASEVALSRKEERKQLDPAKQAQRLTTIKERARRNLLVLARTCKARGMDPLSVKGSWAGALGFPQFMPASLRWAEDGDGDGKIDLFTFDDSIASVARYLNEHGWARDGREKAVWAYNHEDMYVKGVLAFADALTEELKKAPAPAPAASGEVAPAAAGGSTAPSAGKP